MSKSRLPYTICDATGEGRIASLHGADFEVAHLNELRACIAKGEAIAWNSAKSPSAFVEDVGLTALSARLPESSETRSDLLSAGAAATNDMMALAWRILAWGGMHVENGKTLARCDESWVELCKEVAAGTFDRVGAYNAFAQLRKSKTTKGLGPAYFTKLIYFLIPRGIARPPGYIMDQWVSCAINVLSVEPIVRVRKYTTAKTEGYIVSDSNDGNTYERYCRTIEALADVCGLAPDDLEIQLMSKGGHRPASWRSHVLQHRTPNP